MTERPQTYAEAGVDTEFLNRLKDRAKSLANTTRTKYFYGESGSLILNGDLVNIDFPNPRLFFETDGIGTKENLLYKYARFFTAGWDLVASNVNDIIRHGAKPLGMTIDVRVGSNSLGEDAFVEFMTGVTVALKTADCALVGGETAIHQKVSDWSLSGTAFGVVEAPKEVNGETTREGDVILGLGSSGIHTNGTTLAERCLRTQPQDLLLIESKIYVQPILDLLAKGAEVHGMAHVSGEGLTRRIPEILPNSLAARVDKSSWEKPSVFDLIRFWGRVPEEDMFKIFNMGIGYVIILPADQVEAAKAILQKTEEVFEIGRVEANSGAKFVLQ